MRQSAPVCSPGEAARRPFSARSAQHLARAPTFSRLEPRVTAPISPPSHAAVDHCMARARPRRRWSSTASTPRRPTHGPQALAVSHHHDQRSGSLPWFSVTALPRVGDRLPPAGDTALAEQGAAPGGGGWRRADAPGPPRLASCAAMGLRDAGGEAERYPAASHRFRLWRAWPARAPAPRGPGQAGRPPRCRQRTARAPLARRRRRRRG